VLRRIFGPKRDEVTREWRKLHNEGRNDLYSSPNIIRVIKIETNEMGGAYSTYGGEESKLYTGFWWGNLRQRNHSENPGVDGSLILR
jgi:hypothetical protein